MRRTAHPRIGEKQLALVRADGPAVLAWQRRVGLAELRSRCLSLVMSGSVPFVGLWLWGWTPAPMLLFLCVDVVAVLIGDALKLLLAGAVLRRTHAADHKAQQVLSIVGGQEDGTGTYTEHGRGVGPGMLFAIACVCTLFLVPLMAAAFEPLGIGRVREAVLAPWFLWVAGASFGLHVLGAAFAAVKARFGAADSAVLFLDAGGIVGLYAGLLVLIWLPVAFGTGGVIALLAVLFLFRLAFGLFALYWVPRVTRALENRLATPGRDGAMVR